MDEEQCMQFHVGSCKQYEALRVRKPRRRCKSWNHNSKIPFEEELENAENFVSGESCICVSRDGQQLIGNVISDTNGAVFKFSGLKNKESEGLSEYAQDGLNIEGEPDLDACSEEISIMVGASPRISESLESGNRSTPSISSEASNDTIETFGDLTMIDDIDDDMIDEFMIDEMIGEKIVSYYDISVNDMDTGLKHEVSNVKCLQIHRNRKKKSKEDLLKLSNINNKFKFSSRERLHGDKAEIILHKQFGPRYSGKNYIVFKGEMAFAFKYPICYPKSDVNETKWCL